MAIEALKIIKKAELDSKQEIENAELKAKKLVEAAEAEEINIIKITERKALEEIAKLRLSTQQKASEEANKLIRESEEYVKLLKQKSEKNLIKATTSIVSAVLG